MKIAMICEFYGIGLQFQENQLVKYYRKQGHEVIVLTSTYRDVFDYYANRDTRSYPAGTEQDFGATIVRLPYKLNLLHKIRAYRGLMPRIAAFAPDMIYIHDIIPNIVEMRGYLKRHPACRAILDIHMDHSNSGKGFVALRILHGTIRRLILNTIRTRLDAIFAVVPASITFMTDVYGVPATAMRLLPLGADLDLIEHVRATNDRAVTRADLGFSDDTLAIVTGGKVTPRKRLELLLKAVDCEALAHAKVIVIGKIPEDDAAYRAQLQPLIDRLGDRVRFVGWQEPEGAYRYMQAADLAVFPASQSVMWQQSISCGLPLIVGDTGGQDAGYLGPNDNVVVVPPDALSMESFRSAIIALDTDRARMATMADGARRTARELLDWDALARMTLTDGVRGVPA